MRVARVRNLLVEQRVRRPVKVALEEVRDAELGANEVVHEKFDALGMKVSKVVRGMVFEKGRER